MDALEGVTIVDFTRHIAGPYATKLLADLGARVIKVEHPQGDVSRRLPPFHGDVEGIERSGTFHFLNTNKESFVLDLSAPGADVVVDRLLDAADLIVTSFTPASLERLQLHYASIARRTSAPLVTVTNFGHSGPYRDYQLSDTVLFAMGGEMYATGLAGREPLKTGGTSTLLQSGAMVAVAALGALHARRRHGLGQHVDVPLFEVQIQSVDRRSSAILAYRFSGRVLERPPSNQAAPAGGVYPCADGYVEVTASAGNYWNRFMEMVGDEAFGDPKWKDPAFAATPQGRAEADSIVYPWMLARTRTEVWAEARRARAMVAPLFTSLDIYNDSVFRQRGFWVEAEHAVLGTVPLPGRPYVLEKTPWRLRRPVPMLGEHTMSIMDELGFDSSQREALLHAGVVA